MADELQPRPAIEKKRISGDSGGGGKFTPEKVLYVEIDEEITNVFDRLRRLRQKHVALVVPKRAAILQSIVNLKILKKKIDELEKDILIVTGDQSGLQMAQKVGLRCATRLIEKETPPPATAPPSLIRGERPVRLPGNKISISEVIREDKKSFIGHIMDNVKERLRKKRLAGERTRLVIIAPNKQALFTLILVSLLLLLTVAYIALPGATITITPKSSILDPTQNVTFLDFEKNRDLLENPTGKNIAVASFPVRPGTLTRKITHPATGKIFKGENARGNIKVINLSNAPWDLSPRTRFQTQEGLVFRTPGAVRVPAARSGKPGTLDIPVIADEFDALGQTIGERGNIPPSKFFLPGLKNEENRKKLYGESSLSMTGGITKTVKMVSEEDVRAARESMRQDVFRNAVEDLKKYLQEQNLAKKTNLSLLDDRHVTETSEPEIKVPEGIAGRALDQFEVMATYTASSIAFDKSSLVLALKERLMARVDPDKKIVRVEENDISYKFLDKDANAGRVRLTATMRGIQMYELDPDKENGHRFLKKITDHILGLRIKDALAHLQQQTDQIANVEITTWPVWAPTIPNISDNIKFVIKEEDGLH